MNTNYKLQTRFGTPRALLGLIASIAFITAAEGSVIYNSLPAAPAEPFNIPSLGYQATATAEFGDHVVLAGTDRALTNVTFGLSSWALKSNYPSIGDADSYSHPLTLNIYSVDYSGANPAVGSLLTSKTVTADIPYRPAVYSFNGIYFTTSFDFTGDRITLPNEVIVSLAFNTQTYGADPEGVDGPYTSINIGLSTTAPSVGSDAEADALFWNTSFAGFYTDGGAGGVGTLRRDTGWTPYTPTFSIEASNINSVGIAAVPEPSAILFGLATTAVIGFRRRRQATV